MNSSLLDLLHKLFSAFVILILLLNFKHGPFVLTFLKTKHLFELVFRLALFKQGWEFLA